MFPTGTTHAFFYKETINYTQWARSFSLIGPSRLFILIGVTESSTDPLSMPPANWVGGAAGGSEEALNDTCEL